VAGTVSGDVCVFRLTKGGSGSLQIQVRHFPPGTSKWNKIEHRLFSVISKNWRDQLLISYEVIINLIAATTTSTGLRRRERPVR
jgi:hypothetical protein